MYGSAVIDDDGLTVPHPKLIERRFALEPLIEAWPDARLPDGTPVASFLPEVSDQEVRRVAGASASRTLSTAAIVVTIVGALAIWWIFDWLMGRI